MLPLKKERVNIYKEIRSSTKQEKNMFKIQSILSDLLKKKTGIPEINLNDNFITGKLVSNMQEGPMRDLLKQFPKETLKLIIKVATEELNKK